MTQRHVELSNSIELFFVTLPGYEEYTQEQEQQQHQQEEGESMVVGEEYDASSSTTSISVHLIAASDLVNADIVGVSDPYVILSLPNQSATSRTVNNDLDPVFHQNFSFFWNGSDSLHVEVWDFDAFKPDGKHAPAYNARNCLVLVLISHMYRSNWPLPC